MLTIQTFTAQAKSAYHATHAASQQATDYLQTAGLDETDIEKITTTAYMSAGEHVFIITVVHFTPTPPTPTAALRNHDRILDELQAETAVSCDPGRRIR